MPADRLSEVQDTLRRIGWGESIEHNETVRLRKDGSPVEVSLSISPIKAPSGATIGISKVARDITDSNNTRQVLRQQTEELRRIFETSQDLILVTDPKGVPVQISPSSKAILGYAPEEIIGQKRRSSSSIPTTSRTPAKKCARRGAAEGQGVSIPATSTRTDAIVTLSWMGAWSEPVKRHFFVGRDMTESRRAQETLRESEQLARGIIDTALDAFIQMDETRHHHRLEFAGRKDLRMDARTKRSERNFSELIVP